MPPEFWCQPPVQHGGSADRSGAPEPPWKVCEERALLGSSEVLCPVEAQPLQEAAGGGVQDPTSQQAQLVTQGTPAAAQFWRRRACGGAGRKRGKGHALPGNSRQSPGKLSAKINHSGAQGPCHRPTGHTWHGRGSPFIDQAQEPRAAGAGCLPATAGQCLPVTRGTQGSQPGTRGASLPRPWQDQQA